MVVGCVGTGYVLRVELLVQRRLCPIFVKDVGSPGIHEPFHRLTGSQRTPGIWGRHTTSWSCRKSTKSVPTGSPRCVEQLCILLRREPTVRLIENLERSHFLSLDSKSSTPLHHCSFLVSNGEDEYYSSVVLLSLTIKIIPIMSLLLDI